MPSMKLFGARWHIATDALPLFGAVLALLNATWLIVFVVFLLVFSRPRACNHPSSQQHGLVWGTLAFFGLSLVMAVAMVAAGVKGTPFEPSKRWVMQPIMYLQSVKWVLCLGWLPFAIYAAYTTPDSCWTSARRSETVALLWSSVGVIAAVFLTALFTYNLLSRYEPTDRWQKRLKLISKLLGCWSVLRTAQVEGQEQGSAGAALHELAGSFARFFGHIDLEKSDVVAGLVLAEVLQVQQRRVRIAEALRRQGALRCDRALLQRLQIGVGDGSQPGVAADAAPGSSGTANRADKLASRSSDAQQKNDPGSGTQGEENGREAAAGDSSHAGHDSAWEQAAGIVQAHCEECSREDGEGSLIPVQQQQQEQQQTSGQEGGAGSSQQGRSQGGSHKCECSSEGHSSEGTGSAEGDGQGEVAVPVDEHLLSWMRDISEGHNFLLTPSQWAAQLAPHLTPQRSAELYTGSKDYVDRDTLEQAQHWSKFAIAAYGSSGYTWNTPKTFAWTSARHWRARAHLWRWVHPHRRVVAGAKPPVQQKLRESKAHVRHYVGARKVAGVSDDDFVYLSFTNRALGSTPYIILLDRPSKTVVLAIRGSQSYADLITDLMDRPTDITGWVPEDLKKEHQIDGPIKAHIGMFSAAKAVLQDLNSHQILPILLTGEPLGKEERQRQHAMHAVDERREHLPAWERGRRAPAAAQPPAAAAAAGLPGKRSSQAAAPLSEEWDSSNIQPALEASRPKGGGGAGGSWSQEQGAAEEGRVGVPQEQQQEGAAGQGQRAVAGGWLWRLSKPLWGVVPAALVSPAGATVSSSLAGAAGAAGSMLQRWTQPLLGALAGQEPPAPVVFQAYADALQRGEANGGFTTGVPAVQQSGGSDAGYGAEPTAGVPSHGSSTAGSSSAGDRSSGAASSTAGEAAEGCEGFQRVLQERGLDCRGWNLVVTGHSLGAAVAALAAMHFKSWCPGVKAWCFNPPGGMCTQNLSRALAGFATSVVVGKDVISRTGTITFERLLDQPCSDGYPRFLGHREQSCWLQVIVALARTRLSKTRVLLQAKSGKLRRRALQAVFRPVEQVPAEALDYVRGYFTSKCRFQHLFVPMFPPGRTMQLRRLKGSAPAKRRLCGGCTAGSRKGQRGRRAESWDAVWVAPEQVMEEGILLSSRQNSDHSTARLASVLEELVQQARRG